jgi:secondary thiamine-phosphate synthase enzyme
MLIPTSQSIPIDEGRLSLGTWQGIFLFEHRQEDHRRRVLVRVLDVGSS